MSKYLYGASVQGIQGFILESNKLREIAGGSEYVDQICSSRFQDLFPEGEYKQSQLVQGAAGIVRYLFESSELEILKKVVRNFPYMVQRLAPGITVSQAVIKIEEELNSHHISELINKQDAQRNKIQISFLEAPMIAERSRTNGQAAISKEKSKEKGESVYYSQNQLLKRDIITKSDTLARKLGLDKDLLPTDNLDDISGKDKWLAVIHADGNSLGKLIMKANTLLDKNKANVKKFYSEFSKNLNQATIDAAKQAIQEVFKNEIDKWAETKIADSIIPLRPVVIGGDDLTIIVRAKYALDFTHRFMFWFGENTRNLIYDEILKNLGGFDEFSEGLTTCAGIAYIKPNYPFHYAENLAEQLCKRAKEVSKEINIQCAPSSLMFHEVQSSFIGDWDEIVERELKTFDGSFVGGPYFLKEQPIGQPTISDLSKWVQAMNQPNSIKSQIRALITEYVDNPESAKQYEGRLRIINPKSKFTELGIEGSSIFNVKTGKSCVWDIIKLSNIQTD